MKNACLVMNMMSMASVTLWCSVNIHLGTGSTCDLTCFTFLHVVLPFRDPRLGPNMSSATLMSCCVTGQSNIYLVTTSWSVLGDGHIVIFCSLCAMAAFKCDQLSDRRALSDMVVTRLHRSPRCVDGSITCLYKPCAVGWKSILDPLCLCK